MDIREYRQAKKVLDMIKEGSNAKENLEAEMYKAASPEELALYVVKLAGSDGLIKMADGDIDKCASAIKAAGEEIKTAWGAKPAPSLFKSIGGMLSRTGGQLAPIAGKMARYAALAGAFTAIAKATEGIENAAMSRRISKSKEWIKKNHEDLGKDPRFDFYFSSLAEYSPNMAKNPVVAVPILEEMKSWGKLNPKTVESLAGIEERLSKARPTFVKQTMEMMPHISKMISTTDDLS